jgi:hypothetical protein
VRSETLESEGADAADSEEECGILGVNPTTTAYIMAVLESRLQRREVPWRGAPPREVG